MINGKKTEERVIENALTFTVIKIIVVVLLQFIMCMCVCIISCLPKKIVACHNTNQQYFCCDVLSSDLHLVGVQEIKEQH